MHGPGQFSKTIGDFCNAWGDFASVSGFVISFVGFAFTIWGIFKLRKAAKEARDKILKHWTVANFSAAIAAMEDIMRLHRKKDWDAALDRHFVLRRILVELKAGGLTGEQQTLIQASVEQFKAIERVVEGHVSAARQEPNIGRLNEVVRGQIVTVQEISTALKNS